MRTNIYTDTVRVIVSDLKPIILTQPADTTVTNNSRARFHVIAGGADVTYQWQYSANGGSTWKNSTAAAKKAELSIAGTASNAKLLYRCVISNACGSVYTVNVKATVQ